MESPKRLRMIKEETMIPSLPEDLTQMTLHELLAEERRYEDIVRYFKQNEPVRDELPLWLRAVHAANLGVFVFGILDTCTFFKIQNTTGFCVMTFGTKLYAKGGNIWEHPTDGHPTVMECVKLWFNKVPTCII